MPFVDTNSPLTTNHTILTSSVYAILKAMNNTGFFCTKFGGGQKFLFTFWGFYNLRECSGADFSEIQKIYKNPTTKNKKKVSNKSYALILGIQY